MDRLAKIEKVHGLEIDLNAWRPEQPTLPDITYRGIRLIVPMDREQVQLWTIRRETWPDGDAHITILRRSDLYDAEVLGHFEEDWAIYDGDDVMLDGQARLDGDMVQVNAQWITDVRRLPNADLGARPLSFTGIMTTTNRLVQFGPLMVKRIRRLEETTP